mmetsp:Transcript_19137/g.60174  ORF Transcript_19137/g.60174 Transcript_19137/m.60174 type:complete len:550 (-) Transcript_19137:239-1888(-)
MEAQMGREESSGDWGHFAAEEEAASSSCGEENSSDGESSGSLSSESAPSTAGLAELNTWLWDSCELGVAAWMRSGVEAQRHGRRRCYFTTGGGGEGCRYGHFHEVAHAGACACGPAPRRRRRRANGRGGPQQLWCVTPLEPGRVRSSAWETIETAMSPRLCPRVFSREFAGGVIVGASFGSIRIVRHGLTGARCVEFLLMVSVADRCRRSWRRERDFSRHARRKWSSWSPTCRAAWTIAEAERRWLPSVDDFPYVASRHSALEAVLREILFSAETPAELVDLAGSARDDLGPPPSLAEVKTRRQPPGLGPHHLPATDTDLAALFGGRLAETADTRRFSDLIACSPSCRLAHSRSAAAPRRSRRVARDAAPRRAASAPATHRRAPDCPVCNASIESVLSSVADDDDDDRSPALAVPADVFLRRKKAADPPREPVRDISCLSPLALFRAVCFPLDDSPSPAWPDPDRDDRRAAHRRRRRRRAAANETTGASPSEKLLPPLVAALRKANPADDPERPPWLAAAALERHPLFAAPFREHAMHHHDAQPHIIVA